MPTFTTVKSKDSLIRLHGSKVFSKIDLNNACLQILDRSLSDLTTIKTPFGLFKHKFFSLALSCSPAIFQEVINEVLRFIKMILLFMVQTK